MKKERFFEAFIEEMLEITVLVPKTHFHGLSALFYILRGEKRLPLHIRTSYDIGIHMKYECTVPEPIEMGIYYLIEDEYGFTTDLQVGNVIRTVDFDELYAYDGDDLGVQYTEERTHFTLWAPTARLVELLLYRSDDVTVLPMNRTERGVWRLTCEGDLELVAYRYRLTINEVVSETVDPYARAVTVNSHNGIILNPLRVQVPTVDLPPVKKMTDAIIYETHIRDFTIHPASGVEKKATYEGFAERHTKTPKGTSTGIDAVKQLGVTHIEILPINDFGGVDEEDRLELYNWGYNPHHFNAPEGSYSLDPYHPYERIIELKTMIQRLHEEGLYVIIDVVYNHVYVKEESTFEKIVPGYFFRYDVFGRPSNGTGVGNDIASERKMVRKFIVESVRYWLEEYDVDGFRFDLMGILDIQTMRDIRRTVDEIKPGTVIIGEGWDLATTLDYRLKATIHNQHDLPNIGQFNDRFRDSVKGSTFNMYDRGYILGDFHKKIDVQRAIAGSVLSLHKERPAFTHPVQSVNYIECHDNYTLWDKMAKALAHEDDATRRRRQRLGTAIVLFSQGIPFLHSGQEFYRTKQGIENSYCSPDEINWLDWERRERFIDDVHYVAGLIQIRKAHEAFRFFSSRQIERHLSFLHAPDSIIMFQLKNVKAYGPWEHILVILHAGVEEKSVVLPPGRWQLVCDEKKSGVEPFEVVYGPILTVAPLAVYVLIPV